MGAVRNLEGRVMASRWRRRRMCVLIADHPAPAALRDICATGAFIETTLRPPLGSRVELRHPEAGAIEARVSTVTEGGVGLTFARCEESVAFALAAVAADMSQPGS
jgi:hypothetical protein